jgi:acyl dehydratase
VKYFEDIVLNEKVESRAVNLTKEDIIRYAKEWDPQPFHIDEEAAKQYPFGLIASGAHTYSLSVKLWSEISDELIATVGGLGMDEVRFANPVKPGDQLRVQTFNESKRDSSSRPEYGILVSRVSVLNQDDLAVLSYKTAALIMRKPVSTDQD